MKKKKRIQFQALIEKYREGDANPRCPHFGQCGGCMMQDIPYGNQLLLKKEHLNTMLSPAAGVDAINPSAPFGYRNRMDMVTAFGMVGLRRAGDYKTVVDISACPLMQERSEEAYKKVRGLVQGIEGYDYLRHSGYLRYAVVRQGMFTGELMVNFVTAVRENRMEQVLGGVAEAADSVSLLFNSGLADTSFGEPFLSVKRGHIEERLDHVTFQITPNSFFQSNSQIALEMYRKIRESVQGKVLDLYSGVGSISLFVADRAEGVTGVESVKEAVECAEANRERNGIGNAGFLCADARSYLRENTSMYDTIIMDPPRSGMHPKMVKYLNESGPSTLIYMSCNPAAFAADLRNLEKYELQWIEGYDMFPQTPHLETLSVLKRK